MMAALHRYRLHRHPSVVPHHRADAHSGINKALPGTVETQAARGPLTVVSGDVAAGAGLAKSQAGACPHSSHASPTSTRPVAFCRAMGDFQHRPAQSPRLSPTPLAAATPSDSTSIPSLSHHDRTRPSTAARLPPRRCRRGRHRRAPLRSPLLAKHRRRRRRRTLGHLHVDAALRSALVEHARPTQLPERLLRAEMVVDSSTRSP